MATGEQTILSFDEYISSEKDKYGVTWNGDKNYSSLGDDIISQIMEITNKLLNNVIQDNLVKPKGSGSLRKATPGLPKDSTNNIPKIFKLKVINQFINVIKNISDKPKNEQVFYFDILFRIIFNERSIPRSGFGKGNRSLSFLLWHQMYKVFPETSLELLELFPDYGCFRDIDNIYNHYVDNYNHIEDIRVIEKSVFIYRKHICESYYLIFNSELLEDPHDVIRSNIDQLHNDIFKLKKKDYPRISYVGKYIPREGKKFEFIRNRIIVSIFSDHKFGGFTDKEFKEYYKEKSPGFINFTKVTFRKFISCLNEINNTIEIKMSNKRIDEIDPSSVTSGAMNKYEKFFLNEDIDNDDDSYDGTRSYNEDMIDLRHRTIKQASNNALNGKALDSVKLANKIWSKINNYKVKTTDRIINSAQFTSLFNNIKNNIETEYKRKINVWEENGSILKDKPLDPFNIIVTIDTSGSMEYANVMAPAIMIGIILTMLSNFGKHFITFSSEPELVKLNGKDIFEMFMNVKDTNWGASTDILKANKLIVDLMKGYKQHNPDFNANMTHVIITDGQFNSMIQGVSDTSSWNTTSEKMADMFKKAGLDIPNTIYWNMNANSPGFPISAEMKGMQLAEGLSHGMMTSILTNACEFEQLDKNEKTKVANITPVDSFLKTICNPYYNKVTSIVHNVKEKMFNDKEYKEFSISHIKKYQ